MPLLTYLYVAMGGAIGSVGRAAIAVWMTRLTGPEFPWGTILINVVGSFVIGCFGTLTMTDGRFPVASDWRAFVMIGICGGFTTFSSFSLQTLDLARDGRPLQAFANIALSVSLCLASVAAGCYTADRVNETAVRAQAVPAEAPILAVVARPEAAQAVRAAAEQLGRIAGRRVDILTLRPADDASFMPTEDVLMEESGAAVPLADIEAHGIVVATPPGLHAALFASGRPVLAVPADFAAPFGRIVAIAWRDDPHCRAAVRAALPILHAAEQIHVLVARGAPTIPPLLQTERLTPALHAIETAGETDGAALLSAAARLDADLLIIGAYSHGPFVEAMFGGVTWHVLHNAMLPVFLCRAPDRAV